MKSLTIISDKKNERRLAALYFCLFVLTFVLCNNFFWTPNDSLFDQEPYFKMEAIDRITNVEPEIIMLGNSVLETSVDDDYFSKLAKINSIKISSGGAASAFWYLAFKNIIIPSVKQQTTVIVFFRDHYLTEPGFRVDGYYKTWINALVTKNEPLLYKLAYEGKTNFLDRLCYRYLPLYKNKEECGLLLDDLVKNVLVSSWLGQEKGYADRILKRVFSDKNMNTELLTKRQIEAETPKNISAYDFNVRLPRSFLPHMIRLAKTNSIHLMFVRVKSRRDLVPGRQPKELKVYLENLKDYLKKQKILYIDFTNEARIKEEHYADGDHLKQPAGSRLFTELLVEALGRYLNPGERTGKLH